MSENMPRDAPEVEFDYIQLRLTYLDPFPLNPFKVRDDEEMELLCESIKNSGLITPIVVRRKESGRYEILSGHRRKAALEKLGYESAGCRVVRADDDEAIILMVDSNERRHNITPCERGKAYKMKLDALKRQGSRNDLSSEKDKGKRERARDVLAKMEGTVSGRQIQRLIRLTYLTEELQDYVDDGRMKLRPAVELSYVDEETQRDVVDCILELDSFPSHDQAIRIRKQYEKGMCSYRFVRKVMEELKPNQVECFKISDPDLKKILEGLTPAKSEELIKTALKYYESHKSKDKEELSL